MDRAQARALGAPVPDYGRWLHRHLWEERYPNAPRCRVAHGCQCHAHSDVYTHSVANSNCNGNDDGNCRGNCRAQ